ncbi:hypothetical protein [Oerskovia merdavium]|uniref:DUF927 domain-containing protein n=1 Tax=Oerskovia merdavium TaxID=2762227 RepID=A0ABR8U424_9CELL|nr:hypothetical protein [Oerskovia merdavium]MBD7982791.1 hypothetical protein [Oerskovia merdavium]
MTATAIEPQWTGGDYCARTEMDDLTQAGASTAGAATSTGTVEIVTGITGSGADKLASSAVAPLVAAARGYASVTPADVREYVRDTMGADLRSTQAKQLGDLAASGDALVMPWHSLTSHAQGYVSAYQARPAVARTDPKSGNVRKYEQLTGSQTVLDVHPGVPNEWMTGTPKVAFIEGLLKADSVLTAMLLETGISPEELTWPEDGSTTTARARLNDLMSQIQDADQVLVVAVVGVGNWHNNPEWAALDLRGRDSLVCFDGDVGDKWQVWGQADSLWDLLSGPKKSAHVHLLDLSTQATDDGEKVGIDDFLAMGKTWSDALDLLKDRLPPRPPKPLELQVGQWRVNDEAHTVEECVQDTNDYGGKSGAHWETRCRVAGRVLMVETERTPTDSEMISGVFDPPVEGVGLSRALVELSWKDEDSGAVHTAVASGPDDILELVPREWTRRGAHVPAPVKRRPDWPARKGEDWLTAVKEHRAAETVERTSWARMGWVPVQGASPVFIVGEQVVGPDGPTFEAASIGVNESVLSGASRFGVQFPSRDLSPEARAAQVQADFRAVYAAYITNGAWTSKGVAAVILAAMIRPCIPLRTQVSLYITGARGGGKSFTASFVMAGWQPRPGIWSENRLPGAAKDTMASTEHAVARTPIWVMDDLAPSADQRTADMEAGRMGDLIRSIYNGTSKRRMTADMTSRHVADPHALLVITAENQHTVSSVRDRLVTLSLHRGALGPMDATDELVRLRDVDGAPARVVGYVLQHLASQSAELGWDNVREYYEAQLNSHTETIKAELLSRGADQGAASRHAALLADLSLGLSVMGDAASEAGVLGMKGVLEMLKSDMVDLMMEAHSDRAESSPGAAAIQAVSRLLASGRAHIAGLDPMSPPLREEPYSATNRNLGWSMGGDVLRPQGVCVGTLVRPRLGEEVVMLDPRTSFTEAARHYRDLLPSGTTSAGAWSAARDERLLSPVRTLIGGGYQSRTTIAGVDVRGVPVPLSVLLNGGPLRTSDDDHADELGDGTHVPDSLADTVSEEPVNA